MNTVFQVSDCCRACLRTENTLTPTSTTDNDSIKLCDKLMSCVSEIVSGLYKFCFDDILTKTFFSVLDKRNT